MSAIEPPAAPKSNTGKIVGCVGCGCLAVIVAVVGFVAFGIWGVGKAFKSSEPFTQSIAAAEGNPAVVEAIGTPIEPGFMPQGSFNFNNGTGEVDFSIPVSGPKGKGTIRVVGTKASGAPNWEYSTWQLDVEGGDSIPLGQ